MKTLACSHFRVLALALWALWTTQAALAADALRATAVVEQDTVFVGQPFIYQVQVNSSAAPENPDLASLTDFAVQFLGTQNNSSESITVIKGRMSRVANHLYLLSYQLTPKKEGRLVIPSVTVKADNESVQTQPVTIQVNKPAEMPNLKLRLEISKTNCYVGEPVILEATWYIAQQVRSPQFTIPLLDNEAFYCFDPPRPNPQSGRLLEVAVNEGKVVAEEGQGSLEGRSFVALRFRKVLIPKREGTARLEPATVAFETLVGTPRGNMFRKAVIPSNPVQLQVKPLPEEGRPAHFAGHVGQYQIAAAARPTEVNLGDPINLTLRISGPPYLEHVTLPPLTNQTAFSNNFRISPDMDPPKIEGSAKVFNQIIRALRVDLKEIPAVELPYFDTAKEKYQVARSDPIPLTVRLAKVVTAGDAEGLTPTASGSTVESSAQGIAHNYEDLDALKDQRFGPSVWLQSPLWLGLIVFPPSAYVALALGLWLTQRRYANPRAVRFRRAWPQLNKTLNHLASTEPSQVTELVLAAIRSYLGDKLGLAAGSLTFRDVKEPLLHKGVPEETIQGLQELFRSCEAHRYAGPDATVETRALLEKCRTVAAQIEQAFR